MDLRFTSPELHSLDQLSTEILVACVFEDEKPPHGVAGLVDWRLAGSISRVICRGFFGGKLGEVLMLPPKPRLNFDKVLLFGLGPLASFGETQYRACIEQILRTLHDLRARSAVAELPGRHVDAISPERATDLLLEAVGTSRDHDAWTLTETPDAQRAIQRHLQQGRRRGRQL